MGMSDQTKPHRNCSKKRWFHAHGGTIELWTSLDALVLKALALVLLNRLDFAPICYHLPATAGRGEERTGPKLRCAREGKDHGAKAAVRAVCAALAGNPFVFRTDVKSAKAKSVLRSFLNSYYASIDHGILLAQLREKVDDPIVLDLVQQYLRRTIDQNCLYSTVERGISLGCPLSPVMGALYLDVLDRRTESTGLFYVRFMDDWVVRFGKSGSHALGLAPGDKSGEPDAGGTARSAKGLRFAR